MSGVSTDNSANTRFEKIYKEVYPILIRVAFRMTGSQDIAEDLCQDAFIKYYERMDSIPTPAEAKYWLIRVLKNLALNYSKRKERERRAVDRIIREPQPKQESGETATMKAESISAIQIALETLPENLRMVLILKEYGNLNYKEIGSILGISEGNVKVRVYRARERLSVFFKREDLYVP